MAAATKERAKTAGKARKAKPAPATTSLELGGDHVKRLIALTACASPDSARPVIATVRFDGARAFATDSYILGVVDLPEGNNVAPCFVSAEALAKALRQAKITKRNPDRVRLDFNAADITVVVIHAGLFGNEEEFTVRIPHGDGKYPDIGLIVEKATFFGCKGEPPLWNPDNLRRVAALAGVNGSAAAVTMRWQDPLKPIVVEHRGSLLGLVMPMRE